MICDVGMIHALVKCYVGECYGDEACYT